METVKLESQKSFLETVNCYLLFATLVIDNIDYG